MPKGFYIQNGTIRGNLIDLWYGTKEQSWGKIRGNTVKAAASTPYSQYAMGGLVSGPGNGVSDSIPALLSNGEYVIKSQRVKEFGTRLFDSINSGSLPLLAGADRMSSPRFTSAGFASGARAMNIQAPSFSSVGPSVSINSSAVGPTETKTLSNSSVYNYNLSVNVASQSDPNAIAQTVMGQIRSIDSQRIRSNRF
jgi:hypothetical protein